MRILYTLLFAITVIPLFGQCFEKYNIEGGSGYQGLPKIFIKESYEVPKSLDTIAFKEELTWTDLINQHKNALVLEPKHYHLDAGYMVDYGLLNYGNFSLSYLLLNESNYDVFVQIAKVDYLRDQLIDFGINHFCDVFSQLNRKQQKIYESLLKRSILYCQSFNSETETKKHFSEESHYYTARIDKLDAFIFRRVYNKEVSIEVIENALQKLVNALPEFYNESQEEKYQRNLKDLNYFSKFDTASFHTFPNGIKVIQESNKYSFEINGKRYDSISNFWNVEPRHNINEDSIYLFSQFKGLSKRNDGDVYYDLRYGIIQNGEVIREPNLLFHKTKVPECTYDLYYNGISAYSSDILATNWDMTDDELYFDIYGYRVQDIMNALKSPIETRYYKSDTIPFYYYNENLIYKATNRDSFYDKNKRSIVVFGPYINSWTRSIKAMYNKDGVIFEPKSKAYSIDIHLSEINKLIKEKNITYSSEYIVTIQKKLTSIFNFYGEVIFTTKGEVIGFDYENKMVNVKYGRKKKTETLP